MNGAVVVLVLYRDETRSQMQDVQRYCIISLSFVVRVFEAVTG